MTPWTVARQAPLSIKSSRQEYWSGLPFPPPGDLPDPRIKPRSPELQEDFFFYCLSHQAIHGSNSIQFSSVTQSCPTFRNPMNHSTPSLPVHHQLLEFTQAHVHRVSDAISSSVTPFSSCPRSSAASGSFPMSRLFTSGRVQTQ